MPSFTYKAIDGNGDIIRGLAVGSHLDNAHDNITSSGLYVLKIRRSSALNSFYLQKFRAWGIKKKDIIEFASNLSVMLKAGLPFVTSISDIADTVDSRRFRARLLDIKNNIELGSGFSEALSKHPDIFPEIFINMVGVGEATGRLDECLADIALHLQRTEDLKDAIIRALIYPVFALTVTSGALLFWLIYVLPQMTSLFDSLAIELPVTTRLLIAASHFSRSYWCVYFIVPPLFYAVVKLLSAKERTRYYIDSIKLRMPIIKLILHNKLLALFSEQLRILFAAGVTIDKSFDIIIEVMENIVFKKALIQAKDDILLGGKISEALKKHPFLFPNLVVRMISIGESSGNLSGQMDNISEHYLKKLDDISQKIGKLIEPIVIAAVGVLFMIIIVGLFSPIYDIVSKMGG